MRRLLFVRRFPFTLAMLAGLVLVALFSNTYVERITAQWVELAGFAPNDLWYGRLERMFSSVFLTSGGVVFWEALFWVALAVGLAEWLTGSKRTALTFWGVHLLALILLSIIISLAAHQLSTIGLEASELARDVGPSAGYFACLGLVGGRLKSPWAWISGGGMLMVFLLFLALPASAGESAQVKFAADLVHLLAFPLGWLSGWASICVARHKS